MRLIPVLKNNKRYSKLYSYFRGCDFTTDPAEISESRSPDCLNMIADDAGFPQKRVGWRVLHAFTGKVNGMWYAHLGSATAVIVHHGTKLSAYNPATDVASLISSSMHDGPSAAFAHGGFLYILDGENYYRLAYGSGYTMTEVKDVAKTPNTGRGGHYEAEDDGNGGTIYNWIACTPNEEPNLLSSKQTNLMAGDGVNTDFWLTELNTTIVSVEIYSGSPAAWTATSAYTKTEDATTGKTKIAFTTAPAAHPEGAGLDNIRVTFTSSEHPADVNQIAKCTIATQYGYFNDNRFFVSGNPDFKNRDWACGVDDPTYWELNQWTNVGSDQTAIMGYLHYGDVLAIVKQDDNQDAEIYIRSAVTQEDGTVLFPVQQGVKGVGAISRKAFASLRDDALFYAREGVFAVAGTDASQQRTVQNRSFFVDNKIKAEPHKENAVAAVWGNHYVLAFPDTGHCYIADARMQEVMNESYVYEWFYWNNLPACTFLEYDGNLLFGTSDGRVCRMNDDMSCMLKYMDALTRVPDPADPTIEREAWTGGKAIKAHWMTKADTLGTIARYKSMTRRGCTVLLKPFAKSSCKVYVTTDADYKFVTEAETNTWDFAELDFGDIDFNAMATPRVAAFNHKQKRFQMIQVTLENNDPEECFGIFGVQLQYTVNKNIK